MSSNRFLSFAFQILFSALSAKAPANLPEIFFDKRQRNSRRIPEIKANQPAPHKKGEKLKQRKTDSSFGRDSIKGQQINKAGLARAKPRDGDGQQQYQSNKADDES